jgi:ribosomal protein S21
MVYTCTFSWPPILDAARGKRVSTALKQSNERTEQSELIFQQRRRQRYERPSVTHERTTPAARKKAQKRERGSD